MEGQRWAPPSHKTRGRREGRCQTAHETSSERRILQTTVEVQDPPFYPRYLANGEWNGHRIVYDRAELTWKKETAPRVLVQMDPEEIEAFLDDQRLCVESESLLGQPDVREHPLRGVSQNVRLGMERW